MTPHCHFRPPGDLQVWSQLALAASSPPLPHLLLSLLITLLASCYSLTVLRPLLPQGLCTCWSLHLAPSSPLVDAYSFFQVFSKKPVLSQQTAHLPALLEL